MNWLHHMPAINATLNALSGILLVTGFYFMKKKRIDLHKRFMLAACGCSVVFLACYLTYHWFAGSTRFIGTGWVRPLYFFILLTHTVLAALTLPLATTTAWRGVTNQVERHKRIARWTFPIWAYVSATGVLVYLFLYQFFPSR